MDNPWINRHDIAAVQAELAALQARHDALLVSAERLAAANVELGEKLECLEGEYQKNLNAVYEEYDQKIRDVKAYIVEKVDQFLTQKSKELTAAELAQQISDGTLNGASIVTAACP